MLSILLVYRIKPSLLIPITPQGAVSELGNQIKARYADNGYSPKSQTLRR
jgi:hypothetical protein